MSWTNSYPVDLDAVQLLLPLQDVLHAVNPHVDVPHQDGLAHVLDEGAQGHVERLQQLLDGTNVLLVVQDCGQTTKNSATVPVGDDDDDKGHWLR